MLKSSRDLIKRQIQIYNVLRNNSYVSKDRSFLYDDYRVLDDDDYSCKHLATDTALDYVKEIELDFLIKNDFLYIDVAYEQDAIHVNIFISEKGEFFCKNISKGILLDHDYMNYDIELSKQFATDLLKLEYISILEYKFLTFLDNELFQEEKTIFTVNLMADKYSYWTK
jgi:hypothetical protein